MINATLRTQLQAKINAATSSTSRQDLMLMRVAAQGLNLDETNLDVLLAPKLNAIVSADPVTDFVEAWRSLGLDSNVLYTVPFAVNAGDVLYVDPVGGVSKVKYPTAACAGAAEARPSVPTLPVGNSLRSRIGAVYTARVTEGSTRGASAAIVLSDGNILSLFVADLHNNNTYRLGVDVISADGLSILSTNTFNPTITSDGLVSQSHILGVWEQSANVFRVWVTTRESATGNTRKVGYFSVTYNTASNATTYSAGASALVGAAGNDITPLNTHQKQGERYVMIKSSDANLYCLDLQTSTIVEYTAAAGQSCFATIYDHTTAGNEYARLRYGATVKLAKGGSNTLIDPPANLVSDGCFGSSATNVVRALGSRQFLCYNTSTRVAKVVAFASDFLSCNIWSLGTMPASVDLSAGLINIWKNGSRWSLVTRSRIVSFRWDGSTAPTGISAEIPVLGSAVQPANTDLFVLTSADKYLLVASLQVVTNNGGSETDLTSRGFLIVNAAEYHPYETTAFGIVVTGAAAAGIAEVKLLPGSYREAIASDAVNVVSHQGVLTHMKQTPATSVRKDFYVGSSSSNNLSNIAGATASSAEVSKFRGAIASGAGVYFYEGDQKVAVSAGAYDATYEGEISVLTSKGCTTQTVSTTSATVGFIFADLRSGCLAAIASSSGSYYGGLPL